MEYPAPCVAALKSAVKLPCLVTVKVHTQLQQMLYLLCCTGHQHLHCGRVVLEAPRNEGVIGVYGGGVIVSGLVDRRDPSLCQVGVAKLLFPLAYEQHFKV